MTEIRQHSKQDIIINIHLLRLRPDMAEALSDAFV